MTDKLPPLPTVPVFYYGRGEQFGATVTAYYTADQMRAYAEEAVRVEREACVAAVEDIEEKPWYGYENPNTFQDGKWAAMDAIRSRSDLSPKEKG